MRRCTLPNAMATSPLTTVQCADVPDLGAHACESRLPVEFREHPDRELLRITARETNDAGTPRFIVDTDHLVRPGRGALTRTAPAHEFICSDRQSSLALRRIPQHLAMPSRAVALGHEKRPAELRGRGAWLTMSMMLTLLI